MSRERRCVLLLGAGHAHLHTLRRAAEFTGIGVDLVLVSEGDFWYSGLATGVVGGRYAAELDRIDAGALITRGGGRFVRGSVRRIDTLGRRVHLESGASLPYDLLSVNLGSRVDRDRIPGARGRSFPVKPIRHLVDLAGVLERRSKLPQTTGRVLVVGGGASGCEIAANVAARLKGGDSSTEIVLLHSRERLLNRLSSGAAKTAWRLLARRAVRIVTGARVERVDGSRALTQDGRSFGFDILIEATGLRPSPVLRRSGLSVDDEGAVVVDDHLRCVSDSSIFAAGDCIALADRSLAKIGVHAIRQAPVLFENLLATLEGRALKKWKPRRRFLLILNLGEGVGLATWGPFHWKGRSAFWLKDRIDRRFLRKYRGPRND